MKAMKCPECGETATFTNYRRGTYAVYYSAPVIIDKDGVALVDGDNEKELDADSVDSIEDCECDKCGGIVCPEDIEVVELSE